MMRMLVKVLVAAMALFAVGAAAKDTPKESYYIGAGDVELYSGKFMYSNTDVSIGTPGTPAELSLERYYAVRDYGAGPFGMTSGHNHEVRIYRQRYIEDPWAPPDYSFTYYVLIGRTMYTFDEAHGMPITYLGKEPGTHTLSRSGLQGPYEFTGPQGAKIYFGALGICYSIGLAAGDCGLATSMVDPSGRTLSYSYDTTYYRRLRLVASNYGYALGFNYSTAADAGHLLVQVCTVNLAQSTASVTAPCPNGARSATYTPPPNPNMLDGIVSFIDPAGQTTSYTYNNNPDIHNIATIQSPASTAPDVTVGYDSTMKRVSSLTYADGSITTYAYENNNPSQTLNFWTDVTTAAGTTRHNFLSGAVYGESAPVPSPAMITDPLGRVTKFLYSGSQVRQTILPELNMQQLTFDSRGNRTETRIVAKPASALPDIVSTAIFPTTCSNVFTCDKPTSTTDARGNTTDFTYDGAHGGVLTETAPAVGGIRPQKRYTYAQRYAWISTSSGYAQAATPIWLLTQESICRTTAPSGSGCAGGASDEVIRAYDYGPNSGPSNLTLRGMTLTADGRTLRTCYGYDANGWRISETKPRAGLTSCP